jgi:hypothetical protein
MSRRQAHVSVQADAAGTLHLHTGLPRTLPREAVERAVQIYVERMRDQVRTSAASSADKNQWLNRLDGYSRMMHDGLWEAVQQHVTLQPGEELVLLDAPVEHRPTVHLSGRS